MNARYRSELKPKRGDMCPVCHTERITLECEIDAAKCVDCMKDEADFTHARHEQRTIVAHV